MTAKFHKGDRVRVDRPPPPAGTIQAIVVPDWIYVQWDDDLATWIDGSALVSAERDKETKTRRKKG